MIFDGNGLDWTGLGWARLGWAYIGTMGCCMQQGKPKPEYHVFIRNLVTLAVHSLYTGTLLFLHD